MPKTKQTNLYKHANNPGLDFVSSFNKNSRFKPEKSTSESWRRLSQIVLLLLLLLLFLLLSIFGNPNKKNLVFGFSATPKLTIFLQVTVKPNFNGHLLLFLGYFIVLRRLFQHLNYYARGLMMGRGVAWGVHRQERRWSISCGFYRRYGIGSLCWHGREFLCFFPPFKLAYYYSYFSQFC